MFQCIRIQRFAPVFYWQRPWRRAILFLTDLKKLSATALSQQFALRLMLCRLILCRLSSLRNSRQAYCTPRSEWKMVRFAGFLLAVAIFSAATVVSFALLAGNRSFWAEMNIAFRNRVERRMHDASHHGYQRNQGKLFQACQASGLTRYNSRYRTGTEAPSERT